MEATKRAQSQHISSVAFAAVLASDRETRTAKCLGRGPMRLPGMTGPVTLRTLFFQAETRGLESILASQGLTWVVQTVLVPHLDIALPGHVCLRETAALCC